MHKRTAAGEEGLTRRGFLKGAAIGLGSAVAVLTLARTRFGFTRQRAAAPEFPDDSIFAPAKRNRTRL